MSEQLRGPFIKEWREHLSLSQEHLAGQLGIHHSTLSRYETGQRQVRTRMLRRIASVFGMESEAALFWLPPVEGLLKIAGPNAAERVLERRQFYDRLFNRDLAMMAKGLPIPEGEEDFLFVWAELNPAERRVALEIIKLIRSLS